MLANHHDSISLANGRFRAAGLLTRTDALTREVAGRPYLIDETTAVVKFIVPLAPSPAPNETPEAAARVIATRLRDLFNELFVKSVARTVEGEQEVWFLEDSPLGRKLHVFEKTHRR